MSLKTLGCRKSVGPDRSRARWAQVQPQAAAAAGNMGWSGILVSLKHCQCVVPNISSPNYMYVNVAIPYLTLQNLANEVLSSQGIDQRSAKANN